MSFIQEKSHQYSAELAVERGSFPNIENSIYQGQPMRNATCTTIAPTGTISMIAGTTSGIEPVFSLAFSKNVLDGERLIEVNQVFEECLNDLDPRLKEEIIEKVAATGNKEMTGIPEEWKEFLSPPWKSNRSIISAGGFSKHCDNAVSKPSISPSAPRKMMCAVYLLAPTGLQGSNCLSFRHQDQRGAHRWKRNEKRCLSSKRKSTPFPAETNPRVTSRLKQAAENVYHGQFGSGA